MRTPHDAEADMVAFLDASITERQTHLDAAFRENRLSLNHGEGETQERIIRILKAVRTHVASGQYRGAAKRLDHVPKV